MHDAQLPLKDAARLSYVTSNCILPEVSSTVNWFALKPPIPNAVCWPVQAASLRSLVTGVAALIRALGRCDLVKVPRDESVRVLGHPSEQAEYLSDRTRVDRYTSPW